MSSMRQNVHRSEDVASDDSGLEGDTRSGTTEEACGRSQAEERAEKIIARASCQKSADSNTLSLLRLYRRTDYGSHTKSH
jgi:hypothetical protein